MKAIQKLSSIWWRLAENIDRDFLELFIITSQSGGFEPSLGRAFGVGKSTMAIWMAYRAFAYHRGLISFIEENGEPRMVENATEEDEEAIMEEIVKYYLKFSIDEVIDLIKNSNEMIPAIIFDDVQRSCPAHSRISKSLRAKIEYLTVTRQKVANIILTAPSIGTIAKPLRMCITWEIIIPQRGVYEVQFLQKERDFYHPVEDRGRLWYESTGIFPPLPKRIDSLYKQIRLKQLEREIEG